MVGRSNKKNHCEPTATVNHSLKIPPAITRRWSLNRTFSILTQTSRGNCQPECPFEAGPCGLPRLPSPKSQGLVPIAPPTTHLPNNAPFRSHRPGGQKRTVIHISSQTLSFRALKHTSSRWRGSSFSLTCQLRPSSQGWPSFFFFFSSNRPSPPKTSRCPSLGPLLLDFP